jgi:ribosomal protein L31
MMSKEKQIEGMAEVLRHVCEGECIRNKDGLIDCEVCKACHLYEAGYRKQSEGEWLKERMSKFEHRYNCSNCNYRRFGKPTPHCPNCGAKMKGGE